MMVPPARVWSEQGSIAIASLAGESTLGRGLGNTGRRWKGLAWLSMAAAVIACTSSPTEIAPPAAGRPTPSVPSATAAATGTAFARATDQPPCASTAPQVSKLEYPGVAVTGDVPLLVVLPPCYGDEPATYPVVYLLHGKPMTESQWEDMGLVGLLEEGWKEGRWPALIAVAARQPEPIFSNSDGGPGSYEQEFFEGLVPFTQAHWAADTRPSRRAVLGISRGGVWALELGLTHSMDLGGIAALSPALAVNYARPAYDPLSLAQDVTPLPSLFLGAGDRDWARPASEHLAQIWTDRAGEVTLDIVAGDHEEATWVQLLPSALDFLSGPWAGAAVPSSAGPRNQVESPREP